MFLPQRLLDLIFLHVSRFLMIPARGSPNKVFIQFLLVSVETARVLLQSWWARLSTGASREASVDNECLGKSRQVGDDGKSWSTGYLEHLQRTFVYLANVPSPSDSVLDSLWDSLWNSLCDSLWDSMWDSLWDLWDLSVTWLA